MFSSVSNFYKYFFDKIKNDGEAVKYLNCYLPYARSNEALDDNHAYLESISSQIEDVNALLNINEKIRILDFGCGQGRFANGLIFNKHRVKTYQGIDTCEASINWCNKWIGRYNKDFHFSYLPAKNERYNSSATGLKSFPFERDSFDLTFLNSVFSHMMDGDVEFYLAELYRVMASGGLIYLTAFIEDAVSNVEENPEGYLGKESIGSLHRVRYERVFFTKLLKDAGFVQISIKHRFIKRTMQSVVVARKQPEHGYSCK